MCSFISLVKQQESRQERSLVVYRRFILLLAVFTGSYVPVAGQTLAPPIVLAQEHIAPVMTTLRTLSIALPADSFLRSQDPVKPLAHGNLLFSGTFDGDHSLQFLSPIDEVKTLTLRRASLPLVRLWGGRLQLDAFQSTLHSQNVQVGPLGYGGIEGFRPSRQSYLGPLSVHFTGLSLSFHFARDSRTRRPTQAWWRMKQLVGGVLE
jgi:hypothetical protein